MYDSTIPFDAVVAEIQAVAATPLAEVDPATLLALLRARGAVRLRGFTGDLADAAALTTRLGTVLNTVEVTGTQYVGYHGELTYTPFPPDLLCFYCVTPPARDGETMLCDGVALFEAMPPALRDLFTRHALAIHSRWDGEFLQRRLGVARSQDLGDALAALPGVRASVGDDGRWDIHLTTPAWRRSRFGGGPAFVNSILISLHDRRPRPQRAYTLTLDDGSDVPAEVVAQLVDLTAAHTCLVRWQAGDFAVVDNARMLHGRRPTDDPARRLFNMHVAMPAGAGA